MGNKCCSDKNGDVESTLYVDKTVRYENRVWFYDGRDDPF